MHLREALLQVSKIGYTHYRKVGSVSDSKRILALVEDKEVKADRRTWTVGRVGPAQEMAVTLVGGTDADVYAVIFPEPLCVVTTGRYKSR